jgi:asparagine N-glycosylation enzyme membrane subunit Stt3
MTKARLLWRTLDKKTLFAAAVWLGLVLYLAFTQETAAEILAVLAVGALATFVMILVEH